MNEEQLSEEQLINLAYQIAMFGPGNILGTSAIIYQLSPKERHKLLNIVGEFKGCDLDVETELTKIVECAALVNEFSFEYLTAKGLPVPQETDSMKLPKDKHSSR